MALDPVTWVTQDPDLLLVRRFARGDASAYDRLVEKYQLQVSRTAYRLLGWRADVEDVVQEVFLAALRALPRFRGQSSVGTWLTTITVNKCRSYRRRRWLRSLVQQEADAGGAGAAQPADVSADQPLMDRETSARVRGVIDRLPPRYREVIVLRYLEQLSIEEVAEALTARPRTVQVRLHRARLRLREHLADLVKE